VSVRKHRKFKLGFPLKFKRKGTDLVITDNLANDTSINLAELGEFEIKSLDPDGFALFEVRYNSITKPKKPEIRHVAPQVEAGVNGYTLFYSSVPKSTSYGHAKSIYEYYKRSHDLSYYALIKLGNKTRKTILGSFSDPESKIYQMTRIINENYGTVESFDRKALSEKLPSHLNHRRLLKCVLDILVAEKLLVKGERESRRGRPTETFKKTGKIIEFMMVNPRSAQKPNGLNVGQLSLTSD
jgi:hypothetical protein